MHGYGGLCFVGFRRLWIASARIFSLKPCSPTHTFTCRCEVMKPGRISRSRGVRCGDSSSGSQSQLSLAARQRPPRLAASDRHHHLFCSLAGLGGDGWPLYHVASAWAALHSPAWHDNVGFCRLGAQGGLWDGCLCCLPRGPLHVVAWAPP